MIEVRRIGYDVGLSLKSVANAITNESTPAVLEAAQYTAGIIREIIYATFKGRTGNLARSFKETFLGWRGTEVSAIAHSDLIYARIQDEGGVIRPNTVGHLAIPLRDLPVGKWPRHWAKGQLKFIPGVSGGILATVSKGGRITPQYALKKRVIIRGRNYLETARKKAEPGVAEIMGQGVDRAINK